MPNLWKIIFSLGEVNGDDTLLDETNLFSAPNSTVAEPKESVSNFTILVKVKITEIQWK